MLQILHESDGAQVSVNKKHKPRECANTLTSYLQFAQSHKSTNILLVLTQSNCMMYEHTRTVARTRTVTLTLTLALLGSCQTLPSAQVVVAIVHCQALLVCTKSIKCQYGGSHHSWIRVHVQPPPLIPVVVGSLQGLSEGGTLDAITYAACVSGSAWAIATWMAIASQTRPSASMSSCASSQAIAALLSHLRNAVQQPLQNPIDTALISQMVARNVLHGQSFSLVDLWGATIYNALLRPLASSASTPKCLSEFGSIVSSGSVPIPIFTAVSPWAIRRRTEYQWHSFTPYEWSTMIDQTCASTPVWGFGRQFINGSSINEAPEQHLATMLGVFGSVFCAPVKAVLRDKDVADITSQIRILQVWQHCEVSSTDALELLADASSHNVVRRTSIGMHCFAAVRLLMAMPVFESKPEVGRYIVCGHCLPTQPNPHRIRCGSSGEIDDNSCRQCSLLSSNNRWSDRQHSMTR
jgi:hypothetical protein